MAYTTNQSLLAAIKKGDCISWGEFYETYRPLIAFCADQKLLTHEVDDLVQNVMVKVFHACERFNYDPGKGKFRDYFGKIVHNEIVNILRSRPAELSAGNMPDFPEDCFSEIWHRQWEQHLMSQAMTQLKTRVSETTFQAFDLYAVQGVAPGKVAAFLGINITRVYKAKVRCNAMLQEIIGDLQQYE